MEGYLSLYKILSDLTRLRILILLSRERLCVCQIAGILDVPQPRISKNLAKLRDLGLVIDQQEDKYIYYQLGQPGELLQLNLNYILANSTPDSLVNQDIRKLKQKEKYKV